MLIAGNCRYWMLLVLTTLLLAGCGTSGKPKAAQPEEPVKGVEISIKRGTTFSWGDRTFYDAPRFQGQDIQDTFESLILDNLAKKGLRFNQYRENSKMLLSYSVFLGDSITKPQAEKLLSAQPELGTQGPAIESFEQGRLQLVFRNAATGEIVWQQAVSGFASVEMPVELRKQRLLKLVDILFEGLPVAPE